MMQTSSKSIFLWVLFTLMIVGCTTASNTPITTGSFQPVTGRDLRVVTGQTLYVPAYSEVLLGGGLTRELVVTVAVHNTDLDAPIILQSVRYYDTDGNLVRNYIQDAPIEISPLATTGFLVEAQDRVGGWGANFIVEWVAEEPVYEPIVEAVMVSRSGTQGISFISLGRVIEQTLPADIDETQADE